MKRTNTRAASQRRLPLWKQLAFTVADAAVISGVLIAIAGCGGSSGTGGTGPGRLAVAIEWPATSGRLIPAAAKSIKAVLSDGLTILDTKLLVRPTQPPWTTAVTFNNLQAGSVTLTATAYPNADGTGTAQSAGSVPATIASGQQSTVALTMAATVKTLKISPQTPSVTVGANVQLTATAYDASNNVVLVTPGNISWTPTTSGNATVSPATGQTTSATGRIVGTQTVTATESESKVNGNMTVTVTAAGGCTPGTVTGPGYLAKTAWPKFGGASLGNSGKSAGSGAAGVLKWTAQIGKGGSPQAALGPNGTLYIESYYDNKFYAIASTTGKVKWSYTADTGGSSTPAISSTGIAYFGSSQYFYALDAGTGALKWKKRADVSNSPTIGMDGTVYASGAGGSVAYDPNTGDVRWWGYSGVAGYPYVAPPIAADGTVYGAEPVHGGAQLSAMEGKCGSKSWTIQLTASAIAVGADGTIYATADYGFSTNTRVVAVNRADGSIKWSAPNVPVQPTPPAIDDARGVLYVLGPQGQLTALSLADGSKKWSFLASSSLAGGITSNSSPSIAGDGTVYFVAANNASSTLFAIDPATGKSKWTYTPPGNSAANSSTPTIGPDGIVYFADQRQGILYAIK